MVQEQRAKLIDRILLLHDALLRLFTAMFMQLQSKPDTLLTLRSFELSEAFN